ncbi:MAG: sulfoxide reductase heme-binding subunit YedZ [Xanthomonadales bacterium]|nr:sulfoxide reductase heme-binding subunit YedZ [Xanthomonadales bacterium]MCB1629070.1 sulfoxide reductase heme-binding subunit YedZ [Xanthomonadales bacterium]MCB1633708.1 sulfoxide reductase heme-binding subunit YedZ [Xanthomonadales bacterium]
MQTQLNATVAWRLLCFALMACPTLVWIWLATHDGLGADPVAWLTHQSGSWALYALFASLSMTPLRRWTGWTGFLRIRRQLGLWAFFYASIHLLIYLLLDLGVDWRHFLTDVLERPYITVGLLAWLLLLPLALTSNQRMVRRLGRRWKRLHQAVYLIGALACLHYLWLVKADLRWPLFFLGLYAVLMLARSRKLQPGP